MKRTILGTMMCVLLTTAVSAQQNDTLTTREIHRGDRPHKEFRGDRPMQRPMEQDMQRADFREKEFQHKGECPPPRIDNERAMREKAPRTAEEKAEFKTGFLKNELTLTKKQGDKLYKVFLEEAQQAEKTDVSQAERDKQRAATDKKVKKILTDEQYEKYVQLGKRKPHAKPDHIKQHNHIQHEHRPAEQVK